MRIPLSVSTVTLTTHEFAVADWVWSSYFTDCGGKISRLTHSGRKCKQKNTSPLIQACKLVVYINARTYAHINIHTSARRYASNRTQTQNTHTIYTYVPNKHISHTGTNIHTNKHTNKNIYNSTTLKTKAHASTATLPHNPPKHTRPSPQAFTSKDGLESKQAPPQTLEDPPPPRTQRELSGRPTQGEGSLLHDGRRPTCSLPERCTFWYTYLHSILWSVLSSESRCSFPRGVLPFLLGLCHFDTWIEAGNNAVCLFYIHRCYHTNVNQYSSTYMSIHLREIKYVHMNVCKHIIIYLPA